MKTQQLLGTIILAVALSGCQNKTPADSADWDKVYKKVDPKEIRENPVKLIHEWMLVTAGTEESYNTMTASFGTVGIMWDRPATTMFIREIRYTNDFLQKNDYYTLSFFDDEYKPALSLLGTKSGRDSDKIKESGLTPIKTPMGNMTFGEAKMVIECKKIYAGHFDEKQNAIPEIAELPYSYDDIIMYAGEIVNVWVR
ncbi:MAG: flavin reductase [Bacteroidales bacterium]|jgi:flavin reductase (DIM6/NTAB) family NADH-FMN oxidoreductase RutF|nr:flavin reductase [Bacteroidales bacterium]